MNTHFMASLHCPGRLGIVFLRAINIKFINLKLLLDFFKGYICCIGGIHCDNSGEPHIVH
jgi:hypothetical protein